MAKAKVRVMQDADNIVPAEVLAQAIVDISKGMKVMNQSRLTRDAIVALIHDRSKILKGTINIVLNNLDQLETYWLKPVKKK